VKKNLFKKVGGTKIDNIVDYIVDYLERQNHGTMYSNVKISLGCDSQAKRRSVNYAIAIVISDYVFLNLCCEGVSEFHNGRLM